MESIPYIGELLSTGAAVIWAVSVVLFKRTGEFMPPMALNLFKNSVGLVFLFPTVAFVGTEFFPNVPLNYWILLLVSGVIGITFADTMFFVSLEKLGASLTAVVDTSYTPIILFMSFLFLDEHISMHNLIGAGLIMGALLIGSATKPEKGKTRGDIISGTIIGVSGIALMGAGIVMIKPVLNEVNMFWATMVRLVGGLAGMIVLSAAHPNRKKILASVKFSAAWKIAVPASFLGTFLALTMWLGGMKYIQVSRAALLNQLSTIFIFILAIVFLKEPVTIRRVSAIILALSGAILVIV